MNYAAINAKIKAMSARAIVVMSENRPEVARIFGAKQGSADDAGQEGLLGGADAGLRQKDRHIGAVFGHNDYNTNKQANAKRICLYIPTPRLKQLVLAMATSHRDIHFYVAQWKRINALDSLNRRAIRWVFGTEIDLCNIIWMYRLKRYHRIKGAATYSHLIPIRHRLSQTHIQRMADAESPGALLEEIRLSPYGKDFLFNDEQTPEEGLWQIIHKKYRAAALRYPNSLAPILAYLHTIK